MWGKGMRRYVRLLYSGSFFDVNWDHHLRRDAFEGALSGTIMNATRGSIDTATNRSVSNHVNLSAIQRQTRTTANLNRRTKLNIRIRMSNLITDYATVARNVDSGEYDEYDFIIVGGGINTTLSPLSALAHLPPTGTAGCVLAGRLSERSDLRVLVIEAGQRCVRPRPLRSLTDVPQRKGPLREQNTCRIRRALSWSTRLQLLHSAAATCRQQEEILASRYVLPPLPPFLYSSLRSTSPWWMYVPPSLPPTSNHLLKGSCINAQMHVVPIFSPRCPHLPSGLITVHPPTMTSLPRLSATTLGPGKTLKRTRLAPRLFFPRSPSPQVLSQI